MVSWASRPCCDCHSKQSWSASCRCLSWFLDQHCRTFYHHCSYISYSRGAFIYRLQTPNTCPNEASLEETSLWHEVKRYMISGRSHIIGVLFVCLICCCCCYCYPWSRNLQTHTSADNVLDNMQYLLGISDSFGNCCMISSSWLFPVINTAISNKRTIH